MQTSQTDLKSNRFSVAYPGGFGNNSRSRGGVSGCAVTRGHETAGEYADDATITTRVKTRFAKDPSVSAMHIHVNTDKGMVTMSGTAKSQAEREHAQTIAA